MMDFLTAWHEYYGENWVYLSDLKSQIDKGDMYHSQEHEALKSALLLVAGKGDGISSRKLAWFFRKNRNKIADGFKIARGEKKKNRYPWRVLSPLKLPVDEKGESVSYPLSPKNN